MAKNSVVEGDILAVFSISSSSENINGFQALNLGMYMDRTTSKHLYVKFSHFCLFCQFSYITFTEKLDLFFSNEYFICKSFI